MDAYELNTIQEEWNEAHWALEVCTQSIDNYHALSLVDFSQMKPEDHQLIQTAMEQAKPFPDAFPTPEVGLEGIGSALASVWAGIKTFLSKIVDMFQSLWKWLFGRSEQQVVKATQVQKNLTTASKNLSTATKAAKQLSEDQKKQDEQLKEIDKMLDEMASDMKALGILADDDAAKLIEDDFQGYLDAQEALFDAQMEFNKAAGKHLEGTLKIVEGDYSESEEAKMMKELSDDLIKELNDLIKKGGYKKTGSTKESGGKVRTRYTGPRNTKGELHVIHALTQGDLMIDLEQKTEPPKSGTVKQVTKLGISSLEEATAIAGQLKSLATKVKDISSKSGGDSSTHNAMVGLIKSIDGIASQDKKKMAKAKKAAEEAGKQARKELQSDNNVASIKPTDVSRQSAKFSAAERKILLDFTTLIHVALGAFDQLAKDINEKVKTAKA